MIDQKRIRDIQERFMCGDKIFKDEVRDLLFALAEAQDRIDTLKEVVKDIALFGDTVAEEFESGSKLSKQIKRLTATAKNFVNSPQ